MPHMYISFNNRKFQLMAVIIIKDEEKNHKFDSYFAYKDNRIVIKFQVNDSPEKISELISDKYMQGHLLENISIQQTDERTSVDLRKSSIDNVKTKGGRFYELQLNQVELTINNEEMDKGVVINLPPSEIEGLTKESALKINILDAEIIFGYNDETTTSLCCPDNLQNSIVSLISLYYCHPIEILQEIKTDSENNRTLVSLRSKQRSFEKQSSRINLYVHANNVVEFLNSANINHPHFEDLPRYIRQFIDSTSVSEPQKYNMLFAMASSFAEYVLGMQSKDGEILVSHTIRHFNMNAKQLEIEQTIKDCGFRRIKNGKDTDIDNLAELRNESEHCLYSDQSYLFFDRNPSVNAFLYEISCRIVMELAGINRDE